MSSLNTSLAKASPYILSILRIVAALLFIEHGLAEIFWLPVRRPAHELRCSTSRARSKSSAASSS